MSYESKEISVAESKPIELYDFVDSFGSHWRYTSADENQEFASETYEAIPIDRKEIEISSDMFKNVVEVTLERNNPFTNQYISSFVDGVVTLTIYRFQETDHIILWSGLVASIKFDKDGIPTVSATPVNSDSIRVGKRRMCQVLCDHILYDAECNVTEDTYKSIGNLSYVLGTVLRSSTFSDKASGWFVGGKIVVGNAQRLIKSHVGNEIIISRIIPLIFAGNSFTAYRGCDHTPTTCLTVFHNKINYGGDEFLPVKNVFKTGVNG